MSTIMAINQRSNRSIVKKLSRLLTLTLITSVLVATPSANAVTSTVTSSANLIAAGINPSVSVITVGANITLTSNLVINHSLTIIGGTGSGPNATLYGHGVEITGGASVTMNHLDLNGIDTQPDGNYGVMVQGASSLVAHNITMILNSPGKDNDAFNVASGSSLSLDNSSISWGLGVSGNQQYGVYAQSGAGSITFAGDTFQFSASGVPGAHSYLIGMEGASISDYPTAISIGTSTYNSELKLLLSGGDSVASKQAYSLTHSVGVSALNNKVGIIDGVNDGIYTYFAHGWGVITEGQLRAAVLAQDSVINLGADITLTSDLTLGSDSSIYGNGFTLSDFGLITTGNANVSLDGLHLTGVVHQAGDGNYGVMIQGTSDLNANNITMVLNTPGENNDGFNVNARASLNLSNSNISWGADVATGTQQYGVYAQSGASSITFTADSFIFNAPNTAGAHSYLLGMEGALVSNYPAIINVDAATTYNAEMKFLLSGSDSWANKEAYAQTHSAELTTGTFNVGTIGSGDKADGVYSVISDWGVHNESELSAALAGSDSTIYLRNDVTLTSDVSIERSVTLEGNGFTISGGGLITTGTAVVVLSNSHLTGVVHQAGDGNYGVMVQGSSQVTANNITMVLNTPGENNVGFNVNTGATLSLNNSHISWGADVATGTQQYGVYAQSGAGAISFSGDDFLFNAPNTSGAHSYLIGMQGASIDLYPSLTFDGTTNTYNSELKLLLSGADTVIAKQAYALLQSVDSSVGNNKIGIIDGVNNGIYTYYVEGWGVYTPEITGVTAPVLNDLPVAVTTSNTQVSGTLTWEPTVLAGFVGATGYTATIDLTAINGYTLAHVPANFFTVAGATTVTNDAGSGLITAVFPATATNVVITSVSPTGGSVAGGTEVTIRGTDFTDVTSVIFAGVEVFSSMVLDSSTSMRVTVPAHAAGDVAVSIATTNNGSTELVAGYTYLTTPTITSISPVTGSNAGGTTVTLTGSNFSGATSVRFGGVAGTDMVIVSSTSITVKTPAHALGAVDVSVINSLGSASLTNVYTYVLVPRGITVTGENFNTNTSSAYYGISVGFSLSGADIADVASVSVALKRGLTTLVTNTSKSATSFNAMANSYSSEFRVKTGTLTTSSTWNLGDTDWTPFAIPMSAVITVTDIYGSEYSARINLLSETGATWASVLAGAVQLITFTQPAAMTVGDGDQMLTATSDSALSVSIESTTPSVCTIVALKVHAVGAGTCSLTATQAGSGIYAAATSDTKTLVISAAVVPPTPPVYYYAQVALVVVPAVTTLQLTKTTTLSTTGGSGAGAVTYATTTPLTCSVTVNVVTAVAAGSCSISATKAADYSYYSAISPVVTLTISDSDAIAAAKAAADKAAADKVIADAAAAKALADQAAADKAAADQVIADAAAAQAAADAAALTNTISIISVTTVSQRNKITVDLADTYADESATVQFGKKSVVKGKTVWTYVDFYHAILDANGSAVFTRYIALKSSLLLKVGMQVRILVNNKVIRTIAISKL